MKTELEMKKPSMQVGLGIVLGAGIGAAIAVVLGSGGAWLAIGIAVGIVIGVTMSKRKVGSSALEAVRNDKTSLS
jgi:F0F1-type ATP synthase assembly protein I